MVKKYRPWGLILLGVLMGLLAAIIVVNILIRAAEVVSWVM